MYFCLFGWPVPLAWLWQQGGGGKVIRSLIRGNQGTQFSRVNAKFDENCIQCVNIFTQVVTL